MSFRHDDDRPVPRERSPNSFRVGDYVSIHVAGQTVHGRIDLDLLDGTCVVMTSAGPVVYQACNLAMPVFMDGQLVSFHDNGTYYIGKIAHAGIEGNPHNRIAVNVAGVGRFFVHPTRNTIRHHHEPGSG